MVFVPVFLPRFHNLSPYFKLPPVFLPEVISILIYPNYMKGLAVL
ncbi:hypothetical protein CLONEX_02121 [[Clostridium] nexile DSM 1787]|nr:hypothetical protein CLONEX_02121 [[Clostridium] nexile DSM 1787]